MICLHDQYCQFFFWLLTMLSQIRLRDHQPTVHISAQSLDPDIERQRRMNYCASDDSDY